mgnify:CR=1 FL=1
MSWLQQLSLIVPFCLLRYIYACCRQSLSVVVFLVVTADNIRVVADTSGSIEKQILWARQCSCTHVGSELVKHRTITHGNWAVSISVFFTACNNHKHSEINGEKYRRVRGEEFLPLIIQLMPWKLTFLFFDRLRRGFVNAGVKLKLKQASVGQKLNKCGQKPA